MCCVNLPKRALFCCQESSSESISADLFYPDEEFDSDGDPGRNLCVRGGGGHGGARH